MRRISKGQWTSEEDEKLRAIVLQHSGRNWKRIAEFFPNRTDVQCLHRWQKVLNPEVVKGPWTKDVSAPSPFLSFFFFCSLCCRALPLGQS